MIIKNYWIHFFALLAILFCLSPASIVAQTITLYDQPNAQAKAVSTLDLAAGIIPIFKPKEGEWVKVADPRNGNVGWIKITDIHTGKIQSESITYTLPKISDTPSGLKQPALLPPPVVPPTNLSPSDQAKVDAMVKQMQLQEQAIGKYLQQFMSQSIDQMVKALNDYNQQLKKQESTTTAPSSQSSTLETIIKQIQKPMPPPVNQPVPANK